MESGIGIVDPLWFVGVVENAIDERLEGRIQVRAFNIHGTNQDIPTEDLPWATMIVPDVNFHTPPVNAWVFGFFVDGRDAQQPMILGIIPTQYTSPINPMISGYGVAMGQDLDLISFKTRDIDAGQPTLSRLARGEDLGNTYVLQAELNRKTNVEMGGGQAAIDPKQSASILSQDDENPGEDEDDASLTVREGINKTADALGVSPIDLAVVISYETAGTFDPRKAGPTTKWGQHRGLIQFGVPQAKKFGVNWDDPINSQLNGTQGAVYKYMRDAGVQPGMGLLDLYSAVNAGRVGLYNRSDTAAGGTAGTVRDKVSRMEREGHVANAQRFMNSDADPNISPAPALAGTPNKRETWSEPPIAYNAQYPYNRVIETAAGHAVEIDDTPNNERIMIYHKDGSYVQIAGDTMTIKSAGDRYDITEGNYMVYVGGSASITIDGDCHRYIKGNLTEEVDGDVRQIYHGNHELGVAGQMNFNASEDANYRAGRLSFESNVENVNIKVAKTLRFESGESLHLKTKSLFLESTEDTNFKVGANMQIGVDTDMTIKAGSNIFQEAGTRINSKAADVRIGGGSTISLNASTVKIDDIVTMANGEASDPATGSTVTASESATSIEKPAPPTKKIPARPAAADTGVAV